MKLEKYIGRTVMIIYADHRNGFSKRRVKLLDIKDGKAKAFCLERMAPRTFLLDSVLAAEPADALTMVRLRGRNAAPVRLAEGASRRY